MSHFAGWQYGFALAVVGLLVMDCRANAHNFESGSGFRRAATSTVRWCGYSSSRAAKAGNSASYRSGSLRASYASAGHKHHGASIRRTANLSQRNRSGGIR